jgi:succinate dehydrogenase/fumarate reductase flavoprotein subunit
VIVAGAGMAGLACAARARQLGARPTVYEKGDRAGGSMLLSSCVIWRHRTLEGFREECPGGDPSLQALLVDRLDEALAWLESLGAPVVRRETGNPRTIGMRFDPRGLTHALVAAAGEVRLRSPLQQPVTSSDRALVLATGGFAASPELVARHITPEPVALRANPWSSGDGLAFGLASGAGLSSGMAEFYGRNMADAAFGEPDYVPLAQLYAGRALVVDERGEPFFDSLPTWSETDVVQATARRPAARAWYLLDAEALAEPDVAERVEAARKAGAPVSEPRELPFAVPPGIRLGVRVRAAITHTMGGLRVDTTARALREDGGPIEGLYAAGVDAGGVSTGGYSSGLAQALVLGLAAAEHAHT